MAPLVSCSAGTGTARVLLNQVDWAPLPLFLTATSPPSHPIFSGMGQGVYVGLVGVGGGGYLGSRGYPVPKRQG